MYITSIHKYQCSKYNFLGGGYTHSSLGFSIHNINNNTYEYCKVKKRITTRY